MKRLTLLLLAGGTLVAGSGFAHTELAATFPADGATIAEPPENVQLSFSEPVRLTALTVQKADERKQSMGPLPAETTTDFSVALPTALSDGHYVVSWRALSADTHVMTGEFMFAVAAGGAHASPMNHAAMPAGGHHAMPAEAHQGDHGAAHQDDHGAAMPGGLDEAQQGAAGEALQGNHGDGAH